jgi:hypothetical protein
VILKYSYEWAIVREQRVSPAIFAGTTAEAAVTFHRGDDLHAELSERELEAGISLRI